MRILSLLVVTTFLGGCASMQPQPASTAEGKVIGLDEALKSVQNALANARAVPGDKKAGLLPDKVTVVLQLAAKDTQTNTGTATTSVGVALPVSVTVGGTVTSVSGSELGKTNTITLELDSPYFAPSDSVLGKIGGKWKTRQEVDAAFGDVEAFKTSIW